ncbi:MAG: DUF5666 domain-containing protein [Candidatus Omnitrophica bacterium]|nr:DUF5666 domain-containing protein [Candidatus Omnitrophota bacterium]
MKRIVTLVFVLVFVISGICLADEIKGKVSAVDKTKKMFQISGVTIQAADAWAENEQDYPLAVTNISLGDYLEVKGKFTGSSEIKAVKIDRKKPECGVVKGKITSIGAKKSEIIISGIKIKVLADAWLEGPNHVKIPLELFAVGYSVECRGDWTGISELTAFKVTVD